MVGFALCFFRSRPCTRSSTQSPLLSEAGRLYTTDQNARIAPPHVRRASRDLLPVLPVREVWIV